MAEFKNFVLEKKWTNNLLDVEIPRKCKSKLVF